MFSTYSLMVDSWFINYKGLASMVSLNISFILWVFLDLRRPLKSLSLLHFRLISQTCPCNIFTHSMIHNPCNSYNTSLREYNVFIIIFNIFITFCKNIQFHQNYNLHVYGVTVRKVPKACYRDHKNFHADWCVIITFCMILNNFILLRGLS